MVMKKSERRRKSVLNGGVGGVNVQGNLNGAIQQWKRSLKESGKMEEIKRRRHYVKPSLKRKRELEDARYRQQKGFDY